ncbi:MAG: ABC transporter ATP-binding protein [Chloroflexi bacterium]|nr:ABC transporter ATP-binding protein [Chloroflexota bacterium]
MSVEQALVLRGVRYRYAGADRFALDGVDLVVRPGEVVGVTGPSDAGKSTLCLVAAGLAPGTIAGVLEGSVTVDGIETRDQRPHEHAQQAGVLFQNPATQLSGTSRYVWEEVAFGPRNLGLPLGDVVARVEAALAALHIGHFGERDPARLSGGQGQLVALASVLAVGPRYLVLDEPTSQLDPQGTRLVGDALAGIADTGQTGIVLVEHKTDLLAALCSRVLVLGGGRGVREGPAAEVLADAGLHDLGVEPPSAVRLRARLAAAGVSVPEQAFAEAAA